jgi:hypothetical protein
MNLSKKNDYCGSTPVPFNYVACNVKKTGDLSAEEVMRQNYICRLKKIIYEPNFQGTSAGGGNYVYPSYAEAKKTKPASASQKYSTFDSVYKHYDIKPCFL